MKFFNQTINYSFIKDNMGTLVLIPTLFGGIWQLLELASIGTAYIRFFSVSQLVSDGLLIMFLLFIVLYSFNMFANPLLTGWFRECLVEYPEIASTTNGNNIDVKASVFIKYFFKPSTKIASYIILLIFLILILWVVYKRNALVNPFSNYITDNRTTASKLFLLLTYIASTTFILISTAISLLVVLDYKVNIKSRFIRSFSFIILFSFSFFVFERLAKMFHYSFLLPENFKNVEYIQKKVKANTPKFEGWNFEYYNDQYIFITVQDSSCKQFVEVLKFDDLFP